MTPQPPVPADPASRGGAPAPHGAATPPSARSLAEIFNDEIATAVSYERGLAVKAVLSLTFVALVLAARLLFFG
jgi:hypothetical protein